MRLDKMLVNLKYGSRKKCQELIKNNLVYVNGEICKKPDRHINQDDLVKINEQEIKYIPSFILMLNKPKGYISSTVDENYPSVLNLINEPYSRYDLKIVGRLDVNTTGLLLITNNTEYVHKISSPNYSIDKTYEITLKEDMSEEVLNKLLKPHILKDGKNKEYTSIAQNVLFINSKKVYITISQGKYHQIKNMIKYLNNEVILLKRIKIGNLELPSTLELGCYSEVKIEEIL